MAKFKVSSLITNRGGKSFKAVNWFITVNGDDLKFFEWWEEEKKEVKKEQTNKKEA